VDKGKALVMEQFYTLGSLGNSLSRRNQLILEPLDKVADVESIMHDNKRQSLIRIMQRKINMIVDSFVLLTS
jgi:hypothetical protein